ncbi:hypothetical protein [Marinobacter sp. JSM 1782161]|uniref:hypothetical protein n=1 Tax=Marinobacter sp. JSM 1782161 TaxID=2685906 RepID=UPI0014039F2C|nr:hypothetical protein [Marinobacter sp. JSM 1782161]
MERKPDMIRALVFIFVIGLAVTGLTTLHASEPKSRAADVVNPSLLSSADE